MTTSVEEGQPKLHFATLRESAYLLGFHHVNRRISKALSVIFRGTISTSNRIKAQSSKYHMERNFKRFELFIVFLVTVLLFPFSAFRLAIILKTNCERMYIAARLLKLVGM